MTRHGRILGPLALLGLASCVAPLPCDHEKATAAVELWVPKGTSVADARRAMVGHGFECVLERGVEYRSPAAALRLVDVLRCRLRWGWIDDREWQAHLILDPSDRVDEIDVWCSIATLWLP